MIYELKITLKNIEETVWRTVQIDASATFLDLHQTIQAVFDWEDYHLHEFFPVKTNEHGTEGLKIKPVDEALEVDGFIFSDVGETFDEAEESLSDWFVQRNDKVRYVYDFGDDWLHEIVLLKTLKRDKNRTYPYCTKVRNLAPPEDSRGELIEGEIDLNDQDTEALRIEINDILKQRITDAISSDSEVDYWPAVLSKAKEFWKLKPWKTMTDDEIFAVVDPVTEEMLFCSVLGAGEDTFGLGVYIGKEGFSVLMDVMDGTDDTFDIILRQRSLLVSFEDREELRKKDYEHIKQYDVAFRGRKAWPAFISMKPGTEPWSMEQEEARMMLVALEEAINVYKRVAGGLELPDVLDDNILARVPQDKEGTVFEDKQMDLSDYEDFEPEAPPMAISELELKRMQKINTSLPVIVEFSIVHVDMPVQDKPGERPVFPMLVIAFDRSEGTVSYQNLLMGSANTADKQRELLYMFEALGGIPETIAMDFKTAFILENVIDTLGLEVDIQPRLHFVNMIVEGFMKSFPDM